MAHPVYWAPSPGLIRLYFAKDFMLRENQQPYHYDQHIVEKIGRFLRFGVGGGADYLLRNFNSPIMITAFTTIAMIAATIFFYPSVVYGGIVMIFPAAKHIITPAFLKLTCCVITHLTLLGILLRGWGRLCNPELMNRYCHGDLQPIFLGSNRV